MIPAFSPTPSQTRVDCSRAPPCSCAPTVAPSAPRPLDPPGEPPRPAGTAAAARGKIRLVHWFAGPGGRADGLSAHAARLGCCAEDRDILIDAEKHDLADDLVFQSFLGDIASNKVDGMQADPPCETFSNARGVGEGPAQLRGVLGRDRYGLSHLKGKDKEKCRLHTLLAVRTAALAKARCSAGKPWIVENPGHRPSAKGTMGAPPAAVGAQVARPPSLMALTTHLPFMHRGVV